VRTVAVNHIRQADFGVGATPLAELTPGRAKGRLDPGATIRLDPGEIRVFVHDPRESP
jgi:hypothetical protein